MPILWTATTKEVAYVVRGNRGSHSKMTGKDAQRMIDPNAGYAYL